MSNQTVLNNARRLSISFIPAGSEEVASSRLRVYTLETQLRAKGVHTWLGYSPMARVVYVQKRVTSKILNLARLACLLGQIVVYDVDDLGEALWNLVSHSRFRRITDIADIVTTATQVQSDHLASYYEISATVLPCPVDYGPRQPVNPDLSSAHPLRILWFGTSGNVALFQKYANALSRIPDSQVTICTHEDYISDCHRTFPNFRCVPWRLQTFTQLLQSSHLTCLMHDGSECARAKSNNKMITSITWGVPAVVSRTPDYLATARLADIEHAVFDGPENLAEVIEHLRPISERRDYLESAQGVIWEHYSPKAIAARFERILRCIVARQRRGFKQRLPRVAKSFI